MSDKKEKRRKEYEEQRKLIEENCKEEIEQLNRAKATTLEQENKVKELIIKNSSLQEEINKLLFQKKEIETDLIELRKDLSGVKMDIELAKITYDEEEKILNEKKEKFELYCKNETENLLKAKNEAQTSIKQANEALEGAKIAQNRAKDALEEAETSITTSKGEIAKITALNAEIEGKKIFLQSLSDETIARQSEIAKQVESINLSLKKLSEKETFLNSREIQIKNNEEKIKDKIIILEAKEANLNNLERRVSYLIETNNLKGKV